MMRYFNIYIPIALILFSPASAQFQVNKMTSDGMGYLEHLPYDYDASKKKYPLLISLHGIDERGDGSLVQIERVKTHGVAKLIDNGANFCFKINGREECFIVISPQLGADRLSWHPQYIDRIINYSLSSYRIDKNRVYLTGISLGGTGAWNYSYSKFNSPNKLAAIVPIAAGGQPNEACLTAERGIRVWAFHGAKDNTIKLIRGQSMVDAYNNCQERMAAKFTVFANIGHNSWEKAYGLNRGNSLYNWLLNQRTIRTNPSKHFSLQINSVSKLPSTLKEISGITSGNNETLWAHNDGGDLPNLYQIDYQGNIIRTVKITYAANYDWEDIARDREGNIYIGDFGNNKNTRKQFQIYKIPDPSKIAENRISAKKIEFTLSNQRNFPPKNENRNFDIEALVSIRDSLFIFTKNRTRPFNGYSRVYGLPNKSGNYNLEVVDSVFIGNESMTENWITAADTDPEGKNLFLLSYNKLIVISNPKMGSLGRAEKKIFSFKTYSQKEALSFVSNGKLFVADELFNNFLGGNLYSISLEN